MLYFIRLAGLPTTMEFGGTSLSTTAPAPTIEPLPIFNLGKTTAPAPIIAYSSTFTQPHRTAPGAICTPSAIMHS